MRKKTKARKYIDPDAFHLARRKAGLTVLQAAIELDVNERTIRNYENGAVRIPYPCFRLMRSLAGFWLPDGMWSDWSFHKNRLYSPEGRSFEAYELRYVSTFIGIARHFMKTREATTQERSSYAAETVIEFKEHNTSKHGAPSDASASFGAEVRQVIGMEFVAPLGLQEKAA